jgi:hypothetical protein
VFRLLKQMAGQSAPGGNVRDGARIICDQMERLSRQKFPNALPQVDNEFPTGEVTGVPRFIRSPNGHLCTGS